MRWIKSEEMLEYARWEEEWREEGGEGEEIRGVRRGRKALCGRKHPFLQPLSYPPLLFPPSSAHPRWKLSGMQAGSKPAPPKGKGFGAPAAPEALQFIRGDMASFKVQGFKAHIHTHMHAHIHTHTSEGTWPASR